MSKPIIFFDLETTGTDVAKDRIVSIAYQKFTELGGEIILQDYRIVNPGVSMSDEVVAVHGITNEEAAKHPPFKSIAQQVYDDFKDCDICGYNVINFDVPMLWEEFYRCGVTWDLTGVNIIDPGNIFKKKEPRTLSAAMKFYCGKEIEGAHNALNDVIATVAVMNGQLMRYPDLSAIQFMHDSPMAELARFSRMDDRVDLAGKIVLDKDGDPSYNIGKAKGSKVKDDPGFGRWMLERDFSEQTKATLRGLLNY